jgi:streptogramin lyase
VISIKYPIAAIVLLGFATSGCIEMKNGVLSTRNSGRYNDKLLGKQNESSSSSEGDLFDLDAPKITSFSPTSGSKGTVVTIKGEKFGSDRNAVSLQMNGLNLTIVNIDDHEITAKVPDKSGVGPIVLKKQNATATSAEKFRYIYTATTSFYSGGGRGWVDGAANDVRFNTAYQIAIDSKDVLYVSDLGSGAIRKIARDGSSTTLAGAGPDVTGFKDGKGRDAMMKFPVGLDIAPDGNVYVADTYNSSIRKIDPEGNLTTLVGLPYQDVEYVYEGGVLVNGSGSNVRFNRPYGVRMDRKGFLWVADTENSVIRKISPSGEVTTYAGQDKNQDYYRDGEVANALFQWPTSLVFDAQDNVYIADKKNHCIRKISANGMVSTVAGLCGAFKYTGVQNQGYADGKGNEVRFSEPGALAVDRQGMIYVADLHNNVIRIVYPDGVVKTLLGKKYDCNPDAGTAQYVEGKGQDARLCHPQGVVVDSQGNLFISDSGNYRIRKVVLE